MVNPLKPIRPSIGKVEYDIWQGKHGDFSTNVAYKLAKTLNLTPATIAMKIAREFNKLTKEFTAHVPR